MIARLSQEDVVVWAGVNWGEGQQVRTVQIYILNPRLTPIKTALFVEEPY